MTVIPFPNAAPSDRNDALTTRLYAADEAWQNFITNYYVARLQADPHLRQKALFLLFADFIEKLVSEHDLRVQLLMHFEELFLALHPRKEVPHG